MGNMTAAERFSKIGMDFAADANGVLARLYGVSYAHPVSDLRYGVDQPNPSQTPKEHVGRNGLPVTIKLPPTTHYVTIQARLEDGTLSPVRRFDIPKDTRAVSR